MSRYVVADLHGQLDLYYQIKDFIGSDDIVYALGDFGDRGYEPWLTLKLALDDPQFIYIMGNHDLILVDNIRSTLKYMEQFGNVKWGSNDIPYDYTSCLAANGGWGTLKGWADESNRMEYYNKLINLPLEITLKQHHTNNILMLNHAGFTPGFHQPCQIEELLWNRDHIVDGWPIEYKFVNTYIFHGHTGRKYLQKALPLEEVKTINWDECGAVWYADGHKCCLDMDSIISYKTVLLNLDTFEEHIFTMSKDKCNKEVI